MKSGDGRVRTFDNAAEGLNASLDVLSANCTEPPAGTRQRLLGSRKQGWRRVAGYTQGTRIPSVVGAVARLSSMMKTDESFCRPSVRDLPSLRVLHSLRLLQGQPRKRCERKFDEGNCRRRSLESA